MIARRGFLAGILAAGVAPAAIGSQILMPVRKIITPVYVGIWNEEALREKFGDLGGPPVIVVHPDVHRALMDVEVRLLRGLPGFIVSDKLPGTA